MSFFSYNAAVQKPESAPPNDSEYITTKPHKNIKSKPAGSEQGEVSSKTFVTESRGKKVRVTVEFPDAVNEKAETEFQRLLKDLWLKKMELWSGQHGETTVPSHHSKKTEKTGNEEKG